MTDGQDNDNSPPAAYRSALDRARLNNVCIYTVGFGADAAADILQYIATQSGCGAYSSAATSDNGLQLRAQYLKARHQSTGVLVLDAAGQLRQGERQALNLAPVAAGSAELLVSLSWPGQ